MNASKPRTWLAVIAPAILAVAGCRHTDLGFRTNTVAREYGKPVAETWTAAAGAVEKLELKTEKDPHDALGGEILARRADGARVTVNVRSVDAKVTRVMVYVEPGNVDLANIVHERVADGLGLGSAGGGLFGGSSLMGNYAGDPARGAAAARAGFREIGVAVTQEDEKPTRAQIDGRFKDSNPARVLIERGKAGEMNVTFAVGTSRSDDNASLVRKLREAFERNLGR